MIQGLPARRLYTLHCQGAVLHGTYHVPAMGPAGLNRTGILILSGFPMPRSSHGDTAVCWATACAALGYPTFRIDLPGLGDSYGDIPAEKLAFTAAGGYEHVAAEVMQLLVQQYELAGLVVVGHCSGAISAIFAAARTRECHGLILLDPPFHLPPPRKPKLKGALYRWSGTNSIGGRLSRLYDQLHQLRLRLVGNTLPANANLPLLKRWKSVASAGLPILLLTAPEPKSDGAKPRIGKFDYLTHIFKIVDGNNQVTARTIPGANHSFSNLLSKEAVPRHIAEWMPAYFPSEPAQPEADATKPAQSRTDTVFVPASPTFARIDCV